MIKKVVLDNFQLLTEKQGISLGYFVDMPIEGLAMPPIRTTEYTKPGEDGGVVSSIFFDERLIVIKGTIYAQNVTSYITRRQALAAACAQTKDSSGFPTYHTLTITTSDDQVFFMSVITKSLNFDTTFNTFTKFMLTLVAPDALIYRNTLRSGSVISTIVPGGVIYPIIYPVTFAGSSGGSGIVTVNGNASTYPTITITGAVTNPYIYNGTTGQFIQFNLTTTSTSIITIDMANKIATLNGTSILYALVSGSSWWPLTIGTSTIYFSTGSTTDTGTVQITWYDAVYGI